jgi:hypothetical protein
MRKSVKAVVVENTDAATEYPEIAARGAVRKVKIEASGSGLRKEFLALEGSEFFDTKVGSILDVVEYREVKIGSINSGAPFYDTYGTGSTVCRGLSLR